MRANLFIFILLLALTSCGMTSCDESSSESDSSAGMSEATPASGQGGDSGSL